MKKRITSILILCLVIYTGLTATSCFLAGLFSKNVAVSAGSNGSRLTFYGSRVYQIEPMTTEEYFKADRLAAARGNRLYTLTPEHFILDIDGIVLYNNDITGFSKSALLEETKNPDGAIIPKHFDLAYADDFVKDVEIFGTSFDGISMQFLPGWEGFSNDGFYVRSITGVDLPGVYDGITLAGEVTGIDGLPAGYRFFGFEDLQPYDTGDGFLSYLTIGYDFTEAGIQNPEGVPGNWEIPITVTGGNSVQLFFPLAEKIDFGPYANPEIFFNWDLVNLIEIYDAGTPSDYSDDIVTYCLSDPFPVSLTIQENTGTAGSSSEDVTAPKDVIAPAISGANTWNTLQWINPIDEDFSGVVIVRKAGTAPSSKTDGDKVYSSYKPNYVDDTGISGTHYYYRVFTVDYAGNYSEGVVLDQIQH